VGIETNQTIFQNRFKGVYGMQDERLILLVTELLQEVNEIKKEMYEMRKEMYEMRIDMNNRFSEMSAKISNVETEQRRLTNAFWEMSQMMEKVIWEPIQHQGKELQELKERVLRLEASRDEMV
jgi:hypothetical protein